MAENREPVSRRHGFKSLSLRQSGFAQDRSGSSRTDSYNGASPQAWQRKVAIEVGAIR